MASMRRPDRLGLGRAGAFCLGRPPARRGLSKRTRLSGSARRRRRARESRGKRVRSDGSGTTNWLAGTNRAKARQQSRLHGIGQNRTSPGTRARRHDDVGTSSMIRSVTYRGCGAGGTDANRPETSGGRRSAPGAGLDLKVRDADCGAGLASDATVPAGRWRRRPRGQAVFCSGRDRGR